MLLLAPATFIGELSVLLHFPLKELSDGRTRPKAARRKIRYLIY